MECIFVIPLIPSAANFSAASKDSATHNPLAMIATSVPSLKTLPFPISHRKTTCKWSIPAAASPAAIPIILHSAIPQSICLSGKAFLNIPVFVAAAKSASKTTTLGFPVLIQLKHYHSFLLSQSSLLLPSYSPTFSNSSSACLHCSSFGAEPCHET